MNLYRSGHFNTDVLAVRVMLPLVLLVLSRYQNYDFDTIPAKISRYSILLIQYHKYDTIPQIRYDTGIFIYDGNK